MKIALLISGEVRTFVLKEQYLFFKRLLMYLNQFYECVDVFIILKIPKDYNEIKDDNEFNEINESNVNESNVNDSNVNESNIINNTLIQSHAGLRNFKKILKLLQPKYLQCFYDFILKKGFTPYNIQLKMIDMCIDSALKYQSQHNIRYDTFFRIRPDSCFLLNDIDIINKQNCSIYTSIKSDALANDQIIIINKFVLYSWWVKYVKKIIMCPIKVPPEYIIYSGYKAYIVSTFQNWLIRGYKDVKSWDKMSHAKVDLSCEYKFKYIDNYKKILMIIPHDVFLKKIKKIPNIILDTYIPY